MDTSVEERKREEARFHDQREQDRHFLTEDEFLRKYPNKKFYAIARPSKKFLLDWLAARCPGKRVLDYCCGNGDTTLQLAEFGAEAHGIDISAEEIETAKRSAARAGRSVDTHFSVMDAEAMSYPDDHFDIVVCSGVLHHLDLDRAYPELARVLKPTGEIICAEPLGYNPLISWYRRKTPQLRTAWEAEHILTMSDVRKGLRYFGSVDVRYFHLFTILAIPFRNWRIFDRLLSGLQAIDSVVLKIPGIRLMAWQMYMIFSGPR
jgi:2-polyprenyl-3-methyl-5-hydroxy-6-metoxy-1,4-benzoquinol methylase